MASAPGVNQGKGKFLREFFANNRDVTVDSVNAAWNAEGREGGISDSLVSKIKAELGLTNKRSGTEPTVSPKQKQSKVGTRSKKSKNPGRQATPITEGPAASSATHHEVDEDILDELEEDIDELIQRVRETGGDPQVVKALKRARRLLARGHGG